MSKVKEPQVEAMVDILCANMMSDKEQLRDISSMGLKAVIAELPLSASGEHWFRIFLSSLSQKSQLSGFCLILPRQLQYNRDDQ